MKLQELRKIIKEEIEIIKEQNISDTIGSLEDCIEHFVGPLDDFLESPEIFIYDGLVHFTIPHDEYGDQLENIKKILQSHNIDFKQSKERDGGYLHHILEVDYENLKNQL